VSLTSGTGPFGPHAKGRLNFDPPERVVYVEPWPRRVRAFAGDDLIVDSERTVLVYESRRLPRYAFPSEDVSSESAEPEAEVEGYVRVPWGAADRWLEEDEELIVHPHDPYHRIEVLGSSRLVRVRVNGEPVAWYLTHLETEHIVMLGFLYVLEEHRHKGYAKSLSCALIKQAFARGKIPACHVYTDNAPSIRLMESLGFHRVCTQAWGDGVSPR